MNIPENNSLKAEIEELLQLCKESEEEYGEDASYFNEPVSEQEMTEWEEANGVKIPESYKEWLRFTGKCRIVSNTATFWGPSEFHSDYVPEDLVVIGEMIGDGEVVCFSKTTGEFIEFFERKVGATYDDFRGVLKEIFRIQKKESPIPHEELMSILDEIKAMRARGEL
ncbi:MAG: SMI1/KNR4 family protein [Lachnospiraceae bacterium]|nr:SMI1/KNR4 family protein [Lachnospiraceae bacterium]